MENNFRITIPSHGRLIRTNIKSKVKVGMPLNVILIHRSVGKENVFSFMIYQMRLQI